MKEIISIDEIDKSTMIERAIDEDIKRLEETMANEGVATMIKRSKIEDEETLAEIVSRGIDCSPAPSDPTHPISELSTEVETEIDIEGVGTVIIPTSAVTKSHKSAPKTTGPKVFDSGLKVIKTHNEKIEVQIPAKIINVCNSLQRSVDRNEFSIVCKGRWEDGEYIVDEDFKVPKQEVAGASVDYDNEDLERLKLEGYNVVIHSHPFESSNFSASDEETINSHFECSILYSVGKFSAATVAISHTPGVKFILVGNPHIVGEDNLVPESEVNNITKKTYTSAYNNYPAVNNWERDWPYNNHSRNIGRNIGTDPDECEKEYDRGWAKSKDKFREDFRDCVGRIHTPTYIYDPEDDSLMYKNGKPINRASARKIANKQTEIPLRVHGNWECGCHSSTVVAQNKVFRTEEPHANQKSAIFKSDVPKNKDSVKKGRKNR